MMAAKAEEAAEPKAYHLVEVPAAVLGGQAVDQCVGAAKDGWGDPGELTDPYRRGLWSK